MAAVAVLGATVALTACEAGPDCDTGVFVRGADLSGADLAGKQLQLCDLSLIDLSGADLQGANLTLTNLGGSDLTGADLTGANLSWANVAGATLTGADLHGTTLKRIHSGGVVGTPASLPAGFQVVGGHLVGPGAQLLAADLSGQDLRNADLARADLTNVALRGADLGGSDLTGATITGTDLTDAVLGAVTSGGLVGNQTALPEGWAVVGGALRATSIPPHGSSGMTDDSWYYGAGPKVVILGDSLTNSAHDQLHTALLDHATAIVSMPGEGFAGGQGTVALGSPSPVMALRAATFAATGPAVAVVALGTNDASNPLLVGTDPMPYIDSIFGSFGGSCTVGVLIAESAPWEQYDAAKAVAVNASIRAHADVVVDWRLHADPGDIDWDGIHLTPQGRTAFTAALRAGVDACEATAS
ncbi:MAG: pentapeptide repeat-containing protein [Acidimicrobiales bacterium]